MAVLPAGNYPLSSGDGGQILPMWIAGRVPDKGSFGFWGTYPHVEQTPRGIG
jgi:hypothetical protein